MPGRPECLPAGGRRRRAPGYVDFLEAINDPSHEEHDHFLKWCGGSFDPDAFDLNLVNQRLFEVKF
jgi:Plasmid pRiA4b ORF-3-like protein